jgi:hypothetical protein
MYLQSIKSVKHNAAKSVNRSIFKKSRHIGFGVFIVHSSMLNGFHILTEKELSFLSFRRFFVQRRQFVLLFTLFGCQSNTEITIYIQRLKFILSEIHT